MANITEDRGALLEDLVYLHLRRHGDTIEYFRDEKGFEVDFVVRDALSGEVTELVQVCWSLEAEATRKREFRGLNSAMKQLRCRNATIVTWQDESSLSTEKDVRILPAWRFLV